MQNSTKFLIFSFVMIIDLVLIGIIINTMVIPQRIIVDEQSPCVRYNNTTRAYSWCITQYVGSFYNYTIRSDTTKTFSDLKANGGDCWDYAKYYQAQSKLDGLNSSSYNFYHKETEGHRFTILYDYNGYCILDNINYDCFIFAND